MEKEDLLCGLRYDSPGLIDLSMIEYRTTYQCDFQA